VKVGVALDAVESGREGGTFYRAEEAMEGEGKRCGEGNGRRRVIDMPVTGVEARGRPFDEGEMKGVGRQFGSTPTGCGRATDGGARSGGKPGSGGSVGGGR
jgi:hypothetical protein